jgi:uncharacterized membrane protein HdeD (DUF308 family)
MGLKPNKVVIDNETKKYMLKVKIILGVLAAIVLAGGIYYAICYLNETTNYFIEHFLSAIMLIAIGIMALLMPQLNQRTIRGENKGDNMMLLVGFGLIILAIMSIIISYLNLW